MPELPVFDPQQRIATQPTGARTTGVGGAGSQAIQGFGETLQKIGDTWLKATVTNQYTTAKNQTEMGVNQLVEDAKDETDHNKQDEYLDRLNKIGGEDVEINDTSVKSQYDANKLLYMDETRITLEGLFRQKMIANQRVEIVKDGTLSKRNYMTAFSETKRALDTQAYIDRLDGYKEAGFISGEEHISEIEDIKGWDYDRALSDSGNDPVGTSVRIQNGEYNITQKQKNELVNVITASIKRQEKVRDMANLEMHNENEEAMSFTVFEDNETPIPEKITKINEMELTNQISEDYAVKARRYLKSVEKLSSRSTNSEVAQIVRLMYDANERVSDFGSRDTHSEYLKKIKAIQHRIIDSNSLSSDDRASLQREMTNITKKQQAKATIEISREPKYREADKFFSESLPPMFRDEALRTYFYMAGEREMSIEESRKVMRDVQVKIMYSNRQGVLDIFDKGREKYGSGADLRLERNKQGVVAVILYKNGQKSAIVGVLGQEPKEAK